MGERRDRGTSSPADRAAGLIQHTAAALAGASEWVLETTDSLEQQLYFRQGAVHAERQVALETNALTVYRDSEAGRGEAVAQLTGHAGDRDRVADALMGADLVQNPAYHLPAGGASYPSVGLGAHPPAREELAAYGAALEQRVVALGGVVSHVELFSSEQQDALLASSGRRHTWSGTRVSVEVVVAATNGPPFELKLLRRARRLSDLLPDDVLEGAVKAVHDRAAAQLPPSGRMAVVLPAVELAHLMDVVRARANAQMLHQGLFAHRVGDPILEARGDTITMAQDALLPYAEASAPTDTSTVPGRRTTFLEAGHLVRALATPQYAAYLGVEPTGPLGTLDWHPGTTLRRDLLADGPVLEVWGLSSSHPDPLSGDLAAEIRFGYLHNGGQCTPVVGGGLSANVMELLADCRLAREMESHPGYRGPSAARFPGVQVAGGA